MTQNRMGSTRRRMHGKAWVTGALALGVVAATGAVASARESDDHGKREFSRGEGQKHEAEKGGWAQKPQAPQAPRAPQGPACLKLDSRARQAISEAGEGTAYVPMDKVQIVPCPAPQGAPGPAPAPPAPAPAPPAPAPAPPAPAPAPPAPAPAPVPHVTTTAS